MAGLAIASVKTVNGLAIASVKTVAGLDNTSSASYTLVYDCYTASNFNTDIGVATDQVYAGTRYNDASARNLSKITFKLTKGGGSITGKTYKARLWSLSGTALDTELAVSSGVSGDDAWNATSVDFIFVSPFTTTGGTDYAITVSEEGSADAVNYAYVAYNSTGGMPSPPSGAARGIWQSNKAQFANNSGFACEMKAYVSP